MYFRSTTLSDSSCSGVFIKYARSVRSAVIMYYLFIEQLLVHTYVPLIFDHLAALLVQYLLMLTLNC
jgi:hypothetical protein